MGQMYGQYPAAMEILQQRADAAETRMVKAEAAEAALEEEVSDLRYDRSKQETMIYGLFLLLCGVTLFGIISWRKNRNLERQLILANANTPSQQEVDRLQQKIDAAQAKSLELFSELEDLRKGVVPHADFSAGAVEATPVIPSVLIDSLNMDGWRNVPSGNEVTDTNPAERKLVQELVKADPDAATGAARDMLCQQDSERAAELAQMNLRDAEALTLPDMPDITLSGCEVEVNDVFDGDEPVAEGERLFTLGELAELEAEADRPFVQSEAHLDVVPSGADLVGEDGETSYESADVSPGGGRTLPISWQCLQVSPARDTAWRTDHQPPPTGEVNWEPPPHKGDS
jgi:hypothetical protein